MRTSLDQHHDDGGPRPGDRVEQSRLSFGKPEFSQVHTFPAGHPHGIAGDGDRSTVGVESRPRRPRTRSAEHHHRDIGTGRESDRLGEGRQIPADEIAAPAVRDLRAVRSRGLEAAPHGLLQPGETSIPKTQIGPRFQRQRTGCHGVPGQPHQAVERAPVGHHETGEPPPFAQDPGQELPVGLTGDAVEFVVRRHDTRRPGPDPRQSGLQMDLVQLAGAELGGRPVATADRGSLPGEVCEYDSSTVRPEVTLRRPLDAGHQGFGEPRRQVCVSVPAARELTGRRRRLPRGRRAQGDRPQQVGADSPRDRDRMAAHVEFVVQPSTVRRCVQWFEGP